VQALKARLPSSWPSSSCGRVWLGCCVAARGCVWLAPGVGVVLLIFLNFLNYAMSPNATASGRSFAGVQALRMQRIVALRAVTR
jgi:hypothetical protein